MLLFCVALVVAVSGCTWGPDRPEGPALEVVWSQGEVVGDGAEVTASVINYGTEEGSGVVVAGVSEWNVSLAEESEEVSLEPGESVELAFSFGPFDAAPDVEAFNYSVSVRPG